MLTEGGLGRKVPSWASRAFFAPRLCPREAFVSDRRPRR